MKEYEPKHIEGYWQKTWEEEGIYTVSDSVLDRDNFFALVEFSYPSGNLHVGHWYAFAVPDIIARFKRMQGYNVLYPMGFDAFGLPAENAAIKLGADPKVWTYEQMDKMRLQLRSMGASFDWNREIVSCDPSYYKWTQWMFNQFLKNDLVYRAVTKVNWCSKDQTILANEQVVDGMCERCGTEVEQRDQEQWMLRITKFADALIDDLDTLNWPHAIKESQKNWIGRSEGSEIDFKVKESDTKITVFTTRADTLFGVTYVVLAPEHTLVKDLIKEALNTEAISQYITETKKKSELDRQQAKEKTGVVIEGVFAINPVNGEEIPVWIADYVLAGYGTGAVMAVPAHDERDFEFAKKYNLPIKMVVIPRIVDEKNPHRKEWPTVEKNNVHAVVYNPTDNTYLTLKWKNFDWKTIVLGGIEDGEDVVEAARREVREETGYKNLIFKKYLGNPIRSEYSASHKEQNRIAYSTGVYFELENTDREEVSKEEQNLFDVVWMPASEFLPKNITNVELSCWLDRISGIDKPFCDDGVLISDTYHGLFSKEARVKITEAVGGRLVKTYRLRDWGISRQRYWGCPIPIVYDPEGNAHPVPDEHLPWILPTDVDHTPDGTAPLARSKELFERTESLFGTGWRPEVETMDTFVDSSWYFYRYLDSKNMDEFASQKAIQSWMPIDLYIGGAEHTTMHVLYSRFWVKALHSIGLVDHAEAYKIRKNRGLILGPDGNKMSKSKGNVINPDEIVDRLGADTVRMYLGFMGPYGVTVNYPWDPNGVVGVRRFLERVWRLQFVLDDALEIDTLLHKTIKKVTEDIEDSKFNTAISAMMVLINQYEKQSAVSQSAFEALLQLLAPFAPHMTEEIWRKTLGHTESIHLSTWPTYDALKIEEESIVVGVQVNGKVRGELSVTKEMTQEEVFVQAKNIPGVAKWLDGQVIKKELYVPGKIISFVC